MKKFIYPVLGLAIAFSVQSCMDNYKAKYIDEKTLVDDGGTTLIKNGYEGGLTEIKASQLAATNSQNADVKSFAQMMITDHSKANKTLDSLETDKMITEKDTISAEHQELIDSLAKKTGAEFDKAYIAMMVKDHEEAVELFADQVDDKNQTIQDFARKTLPVIQMHLDDAKKLEATLK
jgi:putative membrane protein